MKKRILLIAILAVAIFSLKAYAQETVITESPNVKIVIDGVIGTYDDVPLNVNNRTMLPLRAVLTNLGIPNDDQHIIWSGEDRSVTAITADGSTEIKLQIDSMEAQVNGQVFALDVAPMIYPKNSRTYIPARFVSEALGKKVAWDGSTTTVLITDIERYEAIKEVLQKSDAAMEGIENVSMDLTSTIITTGENPFNMTLSLTAIENPDQPASYIKLGVDMDMDALLQEGSTDDEAMAGMVMMMAFLNMEVYEMEDYTYSQSFLSGDGWLKSETDPETSVSNSSSITVSQESVILAEEDTVLAGLVMTTDEAKGTIVLEGTVFIEDMADQTLSFDSGDAKLSDITDYHVIYILDAESYEVISLQVDIEIATTDENNVPYSMTSSTFVTMDILEEGYKIVVPEEVLNNIVELDFGF